MSWKDGYLRQAASDYEVYRFLNRSLTLTANQVAICHRLHYLQMASEKLAKAFMCQGSQKPEKLTHYVFVRFLQLTKSQRNVSRLLNKNHSVYCSYINSLLDVAKRVEDLAPAGGNFGKLNPEYPWEDVSGTVQIPADYAFSEFSQTDLAKLQTLISDLFRIADKL